MAAKTEVIAERGTIVIERKYEMSYEEFADKHLFGNTPVVIGDATEDWPARGKFTPEFFKKNYENREVKVLGKWFKLGDFIDLMMSGSFEHPAPYPCKLQILTDYPELIPDVTPRFKFALPDRTTSKLLPDGFLGGADILEIFLGSPGGQFPYYHYDYMGLHACINQLYGKKEFTLIPPEQTPCMYPDPKHPWVSLIDNQLNPDFKKFPLFAAATPVSFIVGPGETVFIPNGWWHTSKSITPTISVALDVLNASNWGRFMDEVDIMMSRTNPMKAKVAKAVLGALGGVLSATEKMGLKI